MYKKAFVCVGWRAWLCALTAACVRARSPSTLRKGPEGFRKDTIAVIGELEKLGWQADVILYSEAGAEATIKHVAETADAYVHRISAGALPPEQEAGYMAMLRKLIEAGVMGMPTPEAIERYSAKDALARIAAAGAPFSLPDTHAYRSLAELKSGLASSLATGARVLKQNSGNTGEGVWRLELVDASAAGSGSVADEAMVRCTEAKDNHTEELALGDFCDFCEDYFGEPEFALVDQRFLPGVKAEGEVRVLMACRTPLTLVHKRPAEGEDAFSTTLYSGYEERDEDLAQWAHMLGPFSEALPAIFSALDESHALPPLLWTADLIPCAEASGGFVLSAINATCVSFTRNLELAPAVAAAIRAMVHEGHELVAPEDEAAITRIQAAARAKKARKEVGEIKAVAAAAEVEEQKEPAAAATAEDIAAIAEPAAPAEEAAPAAEEPAAEEPAAEEPAAEEPAAEEPAAEVPAAEEPAAPTTDELPAAETAAEEPAAEEPAAPTTDEAPVDETADAEVVHE